MVSLSSLAAGFGLAEWVLLMAHGVGFECMLLEGKERKREEQAPSLFLSAFQRDQATSRHLGSWAGRQAACRGPA